MAVAKSLLAVETLKGAFAANPTAQGLTAAVREANRAVWTRAAEGSDLTGMGTTLTAVAAVPADGDDRLVVVNIGDSRAYLLQHGRLTRVTQDHTLVEDLVRSGELMEQEARVHPPAPHPHPCARPATRHRT